MFALKELMTRLDVKNIDCRQDGAKLAPSLGRASYLFNTTIAGIEQADALLLVGTNPRLEATVLNARILKRWRTGGLKVGLIGEQAPLTYPYDYLGAGAKTLGEVAEGPHAFAKVLKDAERPMVIIGAGAYARADGAALLGLSARIALGAMEGKDASWNGFNVLHTAASRVAGLDLGFVPVGKGALNAQDQVAAAVKGKLDVLYLLGADEVEVANTGSGSTFVIYQGTHGDAGAHRADVILPAAAYTEKSATYVNTEGRVQFTKRAVFAPGEAKEDWAILRALSAHLDHTLPFDTLTALRSAMYAAAPHLARLDAVAPADREGVEGVAKLKGSTIDEPFVSPVRDFYLTNPIARASAVMAEMSALKKSMNAGSRLSAAE
jgi:NADH-quinone oxidoreductase subunit G